jgi:hypothetical protein
MSPAYVQRTGRTVASVDALLSLQLRDSSPGPRNARPAGPPRRVLWPQTRRNAAWGHRGNQDVVRYAPAASVRPTAQRGASCGLPRTGPARLGDPGGPDGERTQPRFAAVSACAAGRPRTGRSDECLLSVLSVRPRHTRQRTCAGPKEFCQFCQCPSWAYPMFSRRTPAAARHSKKVCIYRTFQAYTFPSAEGNCNLDSPIKFMLG